jgi:hypothetical protein
MRFRPCLAALALAVLAIIFALSSTQAFAFICLDKSMTLDEGVDAISATPGCDRAMKLFQDCSLGTSGDIRLGAAVEKKCESDFLTRLTAPRKNAYQREMEVCDRKYHGQSGTMYRSFTAFCRAQVAQRYSRQSRKSAR